MSFWGVISFLELCLFVAFVNAYIYKYIYKFFFFNLYCRKYFFLYLFLVSQKRSFSSVSIAPSNTLCKEGFLSAILKRSLTCGQYAIIPVIPTMFFIIHAQWGLLNQCEKDSIEEHTALQVLSAKWKEAGMSSRQRQLLNTGSPSTCKISFPKIWHVNTSLP